MGVRPQDGMLSRIYFHVMPEVCKLVPDFNDETEANLFLAKIRRRAWYARRWEARYPVGRSLFANGVRFASERSAQRCTQQVNGSHVYLSLDDESRNPLQVLHILAHALQPDDGPWHGGAFSQTYFDLVERVFDVEMRRSVKKIFLHHKIKTRVVSEASRANYKAAHQTRKGREAKEGAQKMLAELREMQGRRDDERR